MPRRSPNHSEYDFSALFRLRPGSVAGVAEYRGSIRVAWVPGRGRGLLATKQVEVGELLFVNRAFAVGEKRFLVDAAVRKLQTCPKSEHDAVFLLCDGQSTPAELPCLTATTAETDNARSTAARQVDRKKVAAILAANAHEVDTVELAAGRRCTGAVSALFLVGSLLNHSCRPSAARVIFGDTMFVRAVRQLQPGDEITDCYLSVLRPSFERRQVLIENYGIVVDDDRMVVEDALFPERLVRPLQERLDSVDSFQDFEALAGDVERLAWERLEWLGGDSCPEVVVSAALRLSPAIDRMLCGTFMSAFVAVATIASQDGQHARAAAAYARCCAFMEENAPNSAYHVNWALAALCEAKQANLPQLAHFIRYARKVCTGHYGPGVLEPLLRMRAREGTDGFGAGDARNLWNFRFLGPTPPRSCKFPRLWAQQRQKLIEFRRSWFSQQRRCNQRGSRCRPWHGTVASWFAGV